MSLNLLNQTDSACLRIARVTRTLDNISRAFRAIGNETLGRQLEDLCVDLDLSVKEVKDAVSDKIVGDTREAQQASRNVVSAVLAGTQLKSNQP